MRLGAALLLALAAATSGCGSADHISTEPVSWLDGRATIVPLQSAFIAVNDLTPKQERILRFIIGAQKLGAGSYYLPPKKLAANCAAGLLPREACP